MALYTELPAYKTGYDLLVELYQRTKTFSREYKYSLGERLKDEATNLLVYIYKANKSRKENRLGYIETARQNVEIIRLLLRLCKDLKIMGIKGFAFLTKKVEDLSKQLAAWQKYTAGVRSNDQHI